MCSEMPNTHTILIQRICTGHVTGKGMLVQHLKFIIKRKTNIRMMATVTDIVNILENIMIGRVKDID